MNRKILLSAFLMILLCALCSNAMAHDAPEHNRDLRCVLFGPTCKSPTRNAKTEEALNKLYNASYLSIDQFNGRGASSLNYLKTHGIKWLPTSVSKINYTASSKTHRSFTHRGWDQTYQIDKAHWASRKLILLSTVNNVFNFKHTSNNISSYKGQCDSFAALVYYVHLIGDQIENKKYNNEGLEMPLGGRRDDYEITEELLKHIKVLFASQVTSSDYKELEREIKGIDSKLKDIVLKDGGLRSDEDFEAYHQCAEDLMALLQRYVYKLLKNEKFFNKVFY